MRFFVAFIISLLIYALLIWLFITKFSDIEVIPHKKNDHIVKINIRNIPLPKKPTPPTPKAQPKKVEKEPIVTAPKPKVVPKKKPIKKKPIKKRPTVKKKSHKKSPPKKKIIRKKPIHKKAIKKKVPKKKVSKKKIPKQNTTDDIVYIPDAFIEQPKTPKKPNDLASFLGSPSRPQPKSTSSRTYPNRKIRKLYGSSFHNMTPTQQKFIEDNLDEIQEITQRTLTRRGYPEAAAKTGQEGTNVVSFNLHPNGDISNLRLKTRTGYRSLDENTLTLIRVAYKDYPYPKTTTKIVFYVTYSYYGY